MIENTKDAYRRIDLAQVADRIAGSEIRFMADFDAIPYGDEKHRTVHYGYMTDAVGREMVKVAADSSDDTWSVTVSDADNLYYAVDFEWRNKAFCVFPTIDQRSQKASVLEEPVPEAFTLILESSRKAGLSDFEHAPQATAKIG